MNYKESYEFIEELFDKEGPNGWPVPLTYDMFQYFEKNNSETAKQIFEVLKVLLNHNDIEWTELPAFLDMYNKAKVVETRKLSKDEPISHESNTKLYLYSIMLTPPIYGPYNENNYIEVSEGLYAQTTPLLIDMETFKPYRSLHLKWNTESNQFPDDIHNANIKEQLIEIVNNLDKLDKYYPKSNLGILVRYCLSEKR